MSSPAPGEQDPGEAARAEEWRRQDRSADARFPRDIEAAIRNNLAGSGAGENKDLLDGLSHTFVEIVDDWIATERERIVARVSGREDRDGIAANLRIVRKRFKQEINSWLHGVAKESLEHGTFRELLAEQIDPEKLTLVALELLNHAFGGAERYVSARLGSNFRGAINFPDAAPHQGWVHSRTHYGLFKELLTGTPGLQSEMDRYTLSFLANELDDVVLRGQTEIATEFGLSSPFTTLGKVEVALLPARVVIPEERREAFVGGLIVIANAEKPLNKADLEQGGEIAAAFAHGVAMVKRRQEIFAERP